MKILIYFRVKLVPLPMEFLFLFPKEKLTVSSDGHTLGENIRPNRPRTFLVLELQI